MHIEFRHVQLSLPEVASLNTTEKVFVHNEVKSYLTRRPKIDWIYHHLWKENHKKTVVLWIDHMPLDRITREERHKYCIKLFKAKVPSARRHMEDIQGLRAMAPETAAGLVAEAVKRRYDMYRLCR